MGTQGLGNKHKGMGTLRFDVQSVNAFRDLRAHARKILECTTLKGILLHKRLCTMEPIIIRIQVTIDKIFVQ